MGVFEKVFRRLLPIERSISNRESYFLFMLETCPRGGCRGRQQSKPEVEMDVWYALSKEPPCSVGE